MTNTSSERAHLRGNQQSGVERRLYYNLFIESVSIWVDCYTKRPPSRGLSKIQTFKKTRAHIQRRAISISIQGGRGHVHPRARIVVQVLVLDNPPQLLLLVVSYDSSQRTAHQLLLLYL